MSNLGSLLQDIQLVRAQGGMAAAQAAAPAFSSHPRWRYVQHRIACTADGPLRGPCPLCLSPPTPALLLLPAPQDITGWSEGENELVTKWRFSAILDLPWRPRLAAAGGTTHVFDEVGDLARRSPIVVHVRLACGGHCREGCIGWHLAACHMGTGAALLHTAPCLNHRTMPPSFAGQPRGEAH